MSVPIPGGFCDVPQNEWAELNERIGNRLVQLQSDQGHQFQLYKIHSVRKQVVAGLKYIIKAEFENADGKKIICDVSIWEKPWAKFEEFSFQIEDKEYKVTQG